MDSRLLALGSFAVIAAAGFVRKGSRANAVPWLRKNDADRYSVRIVVRSSQHPGEWVIPEEEEGGNWILATAPTRQGAEVLVERAAAFGRQLQQASPLFRDLLVFPEASGMSPYEVWVVLFDGEEDVADLRRFIAGYDDDVLALLLHAEFTDRWSRQRISFRTFASGETP
jgi:hypothetical protein